MGRRSGVLFYPSPLFPESGFLTDWGWGGWPENFRDTLVSTLCHAGVTGSRGRKSKFLCGAWTRTHVFILVQQAFFNLRIFCFVLFPVSYCLLRDLSSFLFFWLRGRMHLLYPGQATVTISLLDVYSSYFSLCLFHWLKPEER